jgi:hypothetical protein
MLDSVANDPDMGGQEKKNLLAELKTNVSYVYEPRQNNSDDCGVYICHFAYCYLNNLQQDFEKRGSEMNRKLIEKAIRLTNLSDFTRNPIKDAPSGSRGNYSPENSTNTCRGSNFEGNNSKSEPETSTNASTTNTGRGGSSERENSEPEPENSTIPTSPTTDADTGMGVRNCNL